MKREILESSNWIVHLDADDLNTFESPNDENIIVQESSTRDSSEKRFSILLHKIAEKIVDKSIDSIDKVIIFIQFPISNPITMNEMSSVHQFVDLLVPEGKDCEIKWGLSPREDDVFRIICAIK